MMGQVLVLGGIAGLLTSWERLPHRREPAALRDGPHGHAAGVVREAAPDVPVAGERHLFIGALSMIAPFFGRKTLVWLVNAGGLAIILAWLMVAVSLPSCAAASRRWSGRSAPPGGVGLGIAAVVLSAGMAILFMPGAPAALAWPYEWVIIGVWMIIGLVFAACSVKVTPGPGAEDEPIASE